MLHHQVSGVGLVFEAENVHLLRTTIADDHLVRPIIPVQIPERHVDILPGSLSTLVRRRGRDQDAGRRCGEQKFQDRDIELRLARTERGHDHLIVAIHVQVGGGDGHAVLLSPAIPVFRKLQVALHATIEFPSADHPRAASTISVHRNPHRLSIHLEQGLGARNAPESRVNLPLHHWFVPARVVLVPGRSTTGASQHHKIVHVPNHSGYDLIGCHVRGVQILPRLSPAIRFRPHLLVELVVRPDPQDRQRIDRSGHHGHGRGKGLGLRSQRHGRLPTQAGYESCAHSRAA